MMNKMMKKIAIAFTAATLTLSAVTPAFANDTYQRTCPINITNTNEVRYVTAKNGLNIRSDANENAPILGSLPYGTPVTVTGYVEVGYAGNFVNWVQVSANGEFKSNNEGTPDYVKTEENKPTKQQYTVKVNGYLALRSEPAFNYSNEIGKLHTGDVVNFKENYGTYWCVYVPATGMIGFVNSNYLV